MGFFKRRSDNRGNRPDSGIQTGRNLGRQPVRGGFTAPNGYSGYRVRSGDNKYGSKTPLASPDAQHGRNPVRRTPPGSQNRTFSYYANRSQADLNVGREALAERPAARRLPTRLQRLRARAGWIAGGLAVLVLLAYQLQLSAVPKVVSLTSSADAPFLRDTKTYQQAASRLIQSSAVNRNKLTINTAAIASGMRSRFPELQSVTVALPLIGDTPVVYIRPAEPSIMLVAANETFVLDQQGRALTGSLPESQAARHNIPVVTDQSGLSFKLGDQALPRGTTQFIQSVADQLRSRSVDVRGMTLPANASELDVYLSNAPYFIKYNTHDTSADAAALQTGTYLALAKYLAGKHVVPSQYVDVRLQGRAYYK